MHQRPFAGGKIDAGRIQDEAAKQIELALAESRGEFGREGGATMVSRPVPGELLLGGRLGHGAQLGDGEGPVHVEQDGKLLIDGDHP